MTVHNERARSFLTELLKGETSEELARRLEPRLDQPAERLPRAPGISEKLLDRRWAVLKAAPEVRGELADDATRANMATYQHNIENFIGVVRVPVGVAGPLRVNGLFAHGDYYVPLATTEAALVASYSRGAQLISEAGGCTAMLLNEGVNRTPAFAFRSLRDVGPFLLWITSRFDEFRQVADATTSHGKLIDFKITVEGNHVYLDFQFSVADAAGQNMVTIATQALVDHIRENSPVRSEYSFVEANMSGDKKASSQSFQGVRGKKVCAEVVLSEELIEKRLRTTSERMVEYWAMSAMGGVLSGTMGVQGHYANGLAALYIACGQDAACVAESAVGLTRFEKAKGGGLYASVTLPNLMVGTVGGGTGLPSQTRCLEILGLSGAGHSQALGEVAAALALAGELSIIGALCAGHFTRAHQSLARKPKGA